MVESISQVEIAKDEELMLFHLVQKLELNIPIVNIPDAYRPPCFDPNRFHAAYMLFALTIRPNLNIPYAGYYRSIEFSDEQRLIIGRWTDWYVKNGAATRASILERHRASIRPKEKSLPVGTRAIETRLTGSPPTRVVGNGFFSAEVPSYWSHVDPGEWREQQ